MTRLLALLALLTLSQPAFADDVEDALQSALQAYRDGDVQYAIDELDFARQSLLQMKTSSLGAYLPDAPEGWTREVNTDMNAGLAMMGGGVGAEATYSGPDAARVKITLMADNPMVSSMGAMVNNAAMMGMKVERINRQRFASKDDQMMALIGNRVLVQGEGPLAQLRMLIETMALDDLAGFGS